MAKSTRTSLLEDGFFLAQETEALAALRSASAEKDRKTALAECSGIDDDAVLDHLVELDIAPETLSAMTLVPLIAVAWADGAIADREVQAILDGATKQGLAIGTPAHGLLTSWLEHEPAAELVSAWEGYVDELLAQLSDNERRTLHERVMGRARAVAEAAGGFLGLATISKAEEAMLDRLDNAFHGS